MNGDGFGSKLNADSNLVGCSDLVLDELQHYAGLANRSVTDNNELEKVMIILDLHGCN